MEDLPLGRIAVLKPEFAVRDLPLGGTLMMMMMSYLSCHFMNNKYNNGKLNCNFTTNHLTIWLTEMGNVTHLFLHGCPHIYQLLKGGGTLWRLTLYLRGLFKYQFPIGYRNQHKHFDKLFITGKHSWILTTVVWRRSHSLVQCWTEQLIAHEGVSLLWPQGRALLPVL